MPTKCHVHNCPKPAVSKGLCDTHRKRVDRNGTLQTMRPADWGTKEKHPAYKTWCNLRRYHLNNMPSEWIADFWRFASDVPSKPKGRVSAQREDPLKPWSRDNFYWREPIVSEEKLINRREYMRQYSRKMREANPQYHKSITIKRLYGISLEEYNVMLAKQNGCCAICEKPEASEIRGKTIALAVDHCHATSAVRALLCSNCNTALGLFNDDPALLVKAQAYVLKYSQSGTTPSLSDRPSGRCTD